MAARPAGALGERRLADHGKSYATPNPFFDNEADRDAARIAYEELIREFTELGDSEGLAQATRRLALVYRTEGRRGLALEWLEKALQHALAGNDRSTLRAVAYSVANDLPFGPTPVAVALPRTAQLLELCGDDRVL